MTIPAVSPLAVVGVTNNSGIFQIQTSVPHGCTTGQTVTIAGCRTTAGALVTGLNTTAAVTVVDTTHFTIPVGYAAGYASGGSVWAAGSKVTSATLTRFDSYLATRVTDKTGDAIFGQYTVPANGITVNGTIRINAPGALVSAGSSTGNFEFGDGDDFVLSPPRTRTIMISLLEAGNQSTVGWNVSDARMGAFCRGNTTVNVPLTRIHHGATLISATLYFFPQNPTPAASTLLSFFPTLQIFRMNPYTDTARTSLAAAGAVTFPTPASSSAYVTTAAVGASGNFALAASTVATAGLTAGTQLQDPSGNLFQITASGTYEAGEGVPVSAVAPASPAIFYGAGTNNAAGTILTWVGSSPAGCASRQPVAIGGLTGGLNAGYAQSLVFTPDPNLALIDQADYVYTAVITDDGASLTTGTTWGRTVYTALKISLGNITSLALQ